MPSSVEEISDPVFASTRIGILLAAANHASMPSQTPFSENSMMRKSAFFVSSKANFMSSFGSKWTSPHFSKSLKKLVQCMSIFWKLSVIASIISLFFPSAWNLIAR